MWTLKVTNHGVPRTRPGPVGPALTYRVRCFHGAAKSMRPEHAAELPQPPPNLTSPPQSRSPWVVLTSHIWAGRQDTCQVSNLHPSNPTSLHPHILASLHLHIPAFPHHYFPESLHPYILELPLFTAASHARPPTLQPESLRLCSPCPVRVLPLPGTPSFQPQTPGLHAEPHPLAVLPQDFASALPSIWTTFLPDKQLANPFTFFTSLLRCCLLKF